MAELDSTAITPVPGEEPFTLEPLIRYMLVARRCVPSSIFIVEGVDMIPMSSSNERRAIRLLLGDGELCIQALLHSDLFGLVEEGEVYVGCYVRVDDFVMRFEEPSEYDEDARGKEGLVYLIVNELQTVGWNETYVAMWRRQQKGKDVEIPPSLDPIEDQAPKLSPSPSTPPPQTPQGRPGDSELPLGGRQSYRSPSVHDAGEEAGKAGDIFEAYEELLFPSRKTTPRKRSQVSMTTTASTSQQPVALPHDWHNHQTPLKLTTLRSIPHLPYTQNWSVNVLAIIISLSDIEPSHLPPGKQRTARIADPSTTKHVHLTVFLDPEGFNPKIGNAVLLTGVKNHRFDGGSLKKYASDAKMMKSGQRWWFEDPWEMDWLDVKGIKAWWAEMEEFRLRNEGPAS